MRQLLLKARKDPQKTAGLSVLVILSIGALVLWGAYLRRPPAATPAYSILSPKPVTLPTTHASTELLAEDTSIIQANSLQLERRRMALDQARAVRTLDRRGVNTGRRAAPPERSALQRLFRPIGVKAAAPTTLPTTQASQASTR